MEIAAVPQRPASGDRRRLLVGLLILLPIILFVLLPAVLGLDRYVITDDSMAGEMGRWSVALARPVPAGELKAKDVITFEAPSGSAAGTLVTRRIQSIDGDVARTKGDATGRDHWKLHLTEKTYPRVVADVPWVGYPFISGGWVLLALIAAGALIVAALAGWGVPSRRKPNPPAAPTSSGGPGPSTPERESAAMPREAIA